MNKTVAGLLKRVARAQGLEDRTLKNGVVKFRDKIDLMDYITEQAKDIEENNKE